MNSIRASLWILIAIAMAACSSPPTKPALAPAAPRAPAAAALNVAGNWLVTIDSQMGSQDSKLVLLQTGKALKGTFDSPMGAAECDGGVNGNNINFGFNFSGQGVELRIDFVGTTDGQTMNGKAVFGSYGEGTFKAKRL